MKKRMWLAPVLLLAAVLLAGCSLRTVEEMYALPKRSEDYKLLQEAMDQAMEGLEYCAPVAGENRQTVQTADLDGDGRDEYLLFARGSGEAPLRILLFRQEGSAYVSMGVIQSNGSAFEQVEYVDMDGKPGAEVIVGSRISDQVLRSLAVYSFAGGQTQQLMTTHFAKFLTCDLDDNGAGELMVLLPGEAEGDRANAVLYHYRQDALERSAEVSLSRPMDSVRRIMVSRLHGDVPAVYVASTVDESAILTDIFALVEGKFTNISFSNESGTSVNTLRNYYVYADDVDDDGILELPALVTMKEGAGSSQRQYLIRWFAMAPDGSEVDKGYTFHNFLGGWYLELHGPWASRVSVVQNDSTFTFYVWDEEGMESERILSLHVFAGEDRQEQAVMENRFVLHRTESVVYAAKLDASSVSYGFTQESLFNSFHLIRQDWNSGET